MDLVEVFRARGSNLVTVESFVRSGTSDWQRPRDLSPRTEWRVCRPSRLARFVVARGEFISKEFEVSHFPVPRGHGMESRK